MSSHAHLKRYILCLGRLGAWSAMVLVALMAILFLVMSVQGTEPQPSAHTLTLEEVHTALEDAQGLRAALLSVDVFFVLAYLAVFGGLFTLTVTRWPVMALVALLLGLVGGGADLYENIQLLWYQFAAEPIGQVAWYRLGNTYAVKWVASGAAVLCFALAWPWLGEVLETGTPERAARKDFRRAGALMVAFGLVALAAGMYDGVWLSLGVGFFLPTLYFAAKVFSRVLS